MWGATWNMSVLTFFRLPLDVPRNATVCLSVTAMDTEASDVLEKCTAAWLLIGATPEIFSPTSQKFNMLPVSWKEKNTNKLKYSTGLLECWECTGVPDHTTWRSYSTLSTYVHVWLQASTDICLDMARLWDLSLQSYHLDDTRCFQHYYALSTHLLATANLRMTS
jgi:hypothetical protein